MAYRKQATEAQKAAAAERRAKLKSIADTVAAMSDAERQAIAARGIRTIEGHELSLRNQAMLFAQFEGVSIVGGFKQWRAAGRQVRKGSKALGILYPAPTGQKDEDGEDRVYFRVGNVFDISQTDPAEGAAASDAPAILASRGFPRGWDKVEPGPEQGVAAYVAEGLGENVDFAPSDNR